MSNNDHRHMERIKPVLVKDIKTEAILVFARTALERELKRIEEENIILEVGSKDDSKFILNTLKMLRNKLQECVVNSDYLIALIENAKTKSELKETVQKEDSLILYHDSIAKRISFYSKTEKIFYPELLVICILCQWILEEERSTNLYPFLVEFNFLELIEIYEHNLKDEKRLIMTDMFKISNDLIQTLKKTKYKCNPNRVSKTRKKKK